MMLWERTRGHTSHCTRSAVAITAEKSKDMNERTNITMCNTYPLAAGDLVGVAF